MKIRERHGLLSIQNAVNLKTTLKGISLQIVNSKPEKELHSFGDSPSLHLVDEVSVPGMTSPCIKDGLTTSRQAIKKHPGVSMGRWFHSSMRAFLSSAKIAR
jgi:hypothetical protein